MVVELYTPSTISRLLDGIQELGWEYGRSGSDRSLIDWMGNVRNGRTAGWTSLGLVSRTSDPHFMRDRVADLPAVSKAAFPRLWSITPSLTALSTTFVLSDQASATLDAALRADYTTLRVPHERYRKHHLIGHVLWGRDAHYGGSILFPSLRRRQEVAKQIDVLEQDCVKWVRENLPGVFASASATAELPTQLLLIRDGVDPLTEASRHMPALSGTGLDESYAAWRAPEWPAARFVFPRGWEGPTRRLVVGCRRVDAIPEPRREHRHEPDSNWSIAQYAQEMTEGLGTRWALSCLLDEYHQRLARYRDESASELRNRPVRDLRDLRRIVRTATFDMLTVASALERYTQNRAQYALSVIEPKRPRSSDTGGEDGDADADEIDMIDGLREQQAERARLLERETTLLLESLGASAGFAQAISNIRLQRLVIALTLISVTLATLAVILAWQAG